jgi:hypothetical protein
MKRLVEELRYRCELLTPGAIPLERRRGFSFLSTLG